MQENVVPPFHFSEECANTSCGVHLTRHESKTANASCLAVLCIYC